MSGLSAPRFASYCQSWRPAWRPGRNEAGHLRTWGDAAIAAASSRRWRQWLMNSWHSPSRWSRPAGFESAVLSKIAPPRARRRGHRALRPAIVIALAAAIGVGIGAVSALRVTQGDRHLAAAYRQTLQTAGGRFITARPLTAPDASRAGTVFAYQGTPSWVFIVVWSGASDGPYQVDLVTRDGQERLLGTMVVTGGEGSWGVKIDLDVAHIAEIRLSGAAEPLSAVFR